MTTTQQEIEFVGESAIKADVVNVMASDRMVANAARVSFNQDDPAFEGHRTEEQNAGLIRYLLKHRHGSPFEHTFFTFLVEAPIAVVREHHRHRAGHSFNEISSRYTVLPGRFYLPTLVRMEPQQKDGTQHSKYGWEHAHEVEYEVTRSHIEAHCRESWSRYQQLLDLGVKREMARGVLPVYTMTRYYWSCNARSLMHFVGLRAQKDAMYEIQLLARDALDALKQAMPATCAAFTDNNMVAP